MKRATVAILIALLAVACGNGGSEQPRIVVTTNILGDVVRAVAGDEAVVEVLIPLGADPHEFQASSAQVATMARADLVVANGLGLEEGLITVLEGLKTDGVNVFEVAPQLDPIEFAGDHDEEEEGGGHAHDLDPHVWMDPLRMARAAELVSDELSRVDPDGGWAGRAGVYAAGLEAAHAEIEQMLETVPADSRVLITNHDTLGYFADRYDWEVLSTVIPGGSTTGAPSSGHLAELVALIRSRGLPAIFVDATGPDDHARAVAAEVGGVEVVPLHTGSLTDTDGPAPTLVELLLYNAREITRALGG